MHGLSRFYIGSEMKIVRTNMENGRQASYRAKLMTNGQATNVQCLVTPNVSKHIICTYRRFSACNPFLLSQALEVYRYKLPWIWIKRTLYACPTSPTRKVRSWSLKKQTLVNTAWADPVIYSTGTASQAHKISIQSYNRAGGHAV